MLNIKQLFTKHPASVGETYFGHLKRAIKLSGSLFIAAFACFVHSLLPFLFETVAGDRIIQLYNRIKQIGTDTVK